jgi:hypothetical protein
MVGKVQFHEIKVTVNYHIIAGLKGRCTKIAEIVYSK